VRADELYIRRHERSNGNDEKQNKTHLTKNRVSAMMGSDELLLCMVRWGSVDECETLD